LLHLGVPPWRGADYGGVDRFGNAKMHHLLKIFSTHCQTLR